MKKILSAVLVLTMFITLCACTDPSPKDFSSNGMTITLTELFKENTQQGYTVCYDSPDVAVFVLKEEFSQAEGFGELTLDEYAELVYTANSSKSPSAVTKLDELTVMEYTFHNESENTTYKYFSTMFKGTDAFFLVQFACEEDKYEAKRDTFVSWAKTVKVD